MKKSYIFAALTAGLLFAGCSKENPFDGDGNGETGKFLKSALAVDVKADEMVRQNVKTRADYNVDDFTVVFTKVNNSEPTAKYKFGEMPEVVELPAGTYTCTATYGENRLAEWENPYFLGKSEEFVIEPYEITSFIEPIECRLENVKVSIDFDTALVSHMSPDSYVEVKVGDNDGLKYTLTEANAEKAGYFMHTAETTLAATFYGSIDGVATVETKSYSNIEKGNHYKLTFRLHSHSSDPTGDVNANVLVDASVNVVNVERNIPVADDPLLEDTDRPSEGGDNPGEPSGPTQPDQPVGNAPTITPKAPLKLEVENDGNSLPDCVLYVTSEADGGITEFTCTIVSEKLDADELARVGLPTVIDLVNTPPDIAASLGPDGLGFPVNIGGQKNVTVDMSMYVSLLGALGDGVTKFVLTVGDANGTTVKNLILKF